jgi:AraC family transcriptional regulator
VEFPRGPGRKKQSWGSISAEVVDRAAGEVVCRSDLYRITYIATDFQASMQDDDRATWECRLSRGTLVFRPPDTTLRSHLTAGGYIQILQSRETYDNLTFEMVRGGVIHLDPRYSFNDPLVSEIALTIAGEMENSFLDRVLADALNTALAAQIMRHFVDPAKIALTPSNGLSRERLKRVQDYIEAHLDDRLTLAELAKVVCLSPYHFSRSFKQTTGVGLHRYVTQRRLERAKTLLQRTNQSLAWVAQEVGFADQSHLASVFRREIGVTPGYFRAAAS